MLPLDELSRVKYHRQTGPEIHKHILCQINKKFWEEVAPALLDPLSRKLGAKDFPHFAQIVKIPTSNLSLLHWHMPTQFPHYVHFLFNAESQMPPLHISRTLRTCTRSFRHLKG
jgi:hypothetical protein